MLRYELTYGLLIKRVVCGLRIIHGSQQLPLQAVPSWSGSSNHPMLFLIIFAMIYDGSLYTAKMDEKNALVRFAISTRLLKYLKCSQ